MRNNAESCPFFLLSPKKNRKKKNTEISFPWRRWLFPAAFASVRRAQVCPAAGAGSEGVKRGEEAVEAQADVSANKLDANNPGFGCKTSAPEPRCTVWPLPQGVGYRAK